MLNTLNILYTYFYLASQPPTTVPPSTTEAVIIETTTPKKIVNYMPPVGQTTVFTVHMSDKGREEIKKKNKFLLKNH